MLHSLLVVNSAGYVLLAKYFAPLKNPDREEWERDLFRETSDRWTHAAVEQVALVGESAVVYRKIGDLLFFIAGGGEYQPLLLSHILNTIVEVLSVHFEKKFTETQLLTHYPKACVLLDEVVQEGHLEQTDIDRLVGLSRSRPAFTAK